MKPAKPNCVATGFIQLLAMLPAFVASANGAQFSFWLTITALVGAGLMIGSVVSPFSRLKTIHAGAIGVAMAWPSNALAITDVFHYIKTQGFSIWLIVVVIPQLLLMGSTFSLFRSFLSKPS
jgi:undecaprenyl pyrophosphate phosphatase UppP